MTLTAPTGLTAQTGSPTLAAVTTPSFTPASSALLIVTVSTYTSSGNGPITYSISDTLGGLSWSKVEAVNDNGANQTTSAIFYAVAPASPVSGRVTVTPSRTGNGNSGTRVSVDQVTGNRTTYPVRAKGTATGTTVSFDSAPVSSSVVYVLGTAGQTTNPGTTTPTGLSAAAGVDANTLPYTYTTGGYAKPGVGTVASSYTFNSLPNGAIAAIEIPQYTTSPDEDLSVHWDVIGDRRYETGLDRGVLFVDGLSAVPWPGLISVSESPANGDISGYYMDGVKFLQVSSSSEFAGSIKAFSAPTEFAVCEGRATLNGLSFLDQPKKSFGLSYRTLIGNDTADTSYGYKIHILYGLMADTPSKEYTSLTNSPEPMNLDWSVKAKAPVVSGRKPTAHFVVNSTKTTAARLTALENILYGVPNTAPRLPSPSELVSLFT